MDDVVDIDRVEVLKGSSGLMNGDGNYGATVNLIRKRPTRDFQAPWSTPPICSAASADTPTLPAGSMWPSRSG